MLKSAAMLRYPDIDPVAVGLGPFKVHWYGLMYLVGFVGAWWLGRRRAMRPHSGWSALEVNDVVFYVALGVVLGGRLGYVMFYDTATFIHEPWLLFKIWQGGMSVHGGLLGVIVAMWLFARHARKPFLVVADFVAPLVPIGLGAGRIGNFINGELWGRPTDLPWGMVFPHVDTLPRHPSMLYEAALEGVLLFVMLWLFSARLRPRGAVSGLFLLGYGVMRWAVEWVREPDAHLGYLAFGWLTMGQLLTLPMVLLGALMLWMAYRAAVPTVGAKIKRP